MAKDRWKIRRIEERLASDLHSAIALYRTAVVRRTEAASRVVAAPFSDSQLQIRQSQHECDEARARLEGARERWEAFVRRGVIPEDLADGDLSSSTRPNGDTEA